DLLMAAGMSLAVLILFLLRFPVAAVELPIADRLTPGPPKAPMVPAFQALLAREKVEESKKEAERARDPEAKKVLGSIAKLWKQIQERTIDKRDLWKKIAALQQQKFSGLNAEDKDELGRLKKLGQQMEKSKVAERLSQALQKGDLAKAQEALRELARRLQDK